MDLHDRTLLRLADPLAREDLFDPELRQAIFAAHHPDASPPDTLSLEVLRLELTPELGPDLWLDAGAEVSLTWSVEGAPDGSLRAPLAIVFLPQDLPWRDALRHAARARALLPERAVLLWLTPASRLDDPGWPGDAGDLRSTSKSKRRAARLGRAAPWLLDTRRIILHPLDDTDPQSK